MRFAALLISPVLMLTGCLSMPPSISVDSVEVVSRSDQAMALHYNLVLSNPNDQPIEPLEFTYSVSVAGRGVYQGRHAAEMTLDAAGQDRPLILPAVIPYERVGWTERTIPESERWSLSGALVYVSEGVFSETLLDLGYRPSTGFSASGTLNTVGQMGPTQDDGASAQTDSSVQTALSSPPAGS